MQAGRRNHALPHASDGTSDPLDSLPDQSPTATGLTWCDGHPGTPTGSRLLTSVRRPTELRLLTLATAGRCLPPLGSDEDFVQIRVHLDLQVDGSLPTLEAGRATPPTRLSRWRRRKAPYRERLAAPRANGKRSVSSPLLPNLKFPRFTAEARRCQPRSCPARTGCRRTAPHNLWLSGHPPRRR